MKLFSILSMTLLLACGNNNTSDSNPATQTQEKEDAFLTTYQSMNHIMSAIELSKTGKTAVTDATRPKLENMGTHLRGKCNMEYIKPLPTGVVTGVPEERISIKATGDSCAIDHVFTLEPKQSGVSTEFALTWKYSVKENAYREMNDVDQIDISGISKEQFTSGSTGISFEKKVDVAGTINSQKYGIINYSSTGTLKTTDVDGVTKGNGTFITEYKFPTFVTQFKREISVNGTQSVTYFYNGTAISETQYRDLTKLGPDLLIVE